MKPGELYKITRRTVVYPNTDWTNLAELGVLEAGELYIATCSFSSDDQSAIGDRYFEVRQFDSVLVIENSGHDAKVLTSRGVYVVDVRAVQNGLSLVRRPV
jgi:hypothetical protein